MSGSTRKPSCAVVSLTVRDDIQLPKDTGAAITSESLLGGKYISLSPGGDETDLKPGQTITITAVLDQPGGTSWASSSSASPALNMRRAAQRNGKAGHGPASQVRNTGAPGAV